ncbi:MAG: S8 family serine peptidase [Erysipelotrichaceae bacterium]|nr:S8 family serine peptidase [Erysipelotrichaceae bacterium]
MKKRLSILLVLMCLFTGMFSANPVLAEDTGEDTETTTEIFGFETDEETEEAVLEQEETLPLEEAGEDSAPPVETESEEEKRFSTPKGFVVRQRDIKGKELIKENGVPEKLPDLVEGKDCKEKELVFYAESREYAETVAEIYHAELSSLNNGVAVITITDESVSVADAVEAALNENDLPLVEPNYITRLHPPVDSHEMYQEHFTSGETLYNNLGWSEWINDVFGDEADPYLLYPGTSRWEWEDSNDAFQWQHDAINTYAAWNTTMGEYITIAVIDEGVNPNHEEFDEKSWGTTSVINIGCGTGYGSGHGNHVAGIIAAGAGNAYGGAGVAPEADIISINVFDSSGGAESANIAAAIYEAINKRVDIINMSLGNYWFSSVENDAVQAAYSEGIVVVAAAGNDGTDIMNFPAAFDHVIAVAATTKNGTKASYSNYGSWVTIAAPGSDIVSVFSTSESETDTYEIESGTSMAAPVVSGALALYMSKVGHIDYDEAIKVLKASAKKSSSPQIGFGVINLELMFKKITQTPIITVYDYNGNYVTDLSKPVPEGSYVVIDRMENWVYDGKDHEYILYSTNGKAPSIKNGEVVNGTVYNNGTVIQLDKFEKGKAITLMAAVVNGMGVLGKAEKVKILTPKIEDAVNKVNTISADKTSITLQKFHDLEADESYAWEDHNFTTVNVSLLDIEGNPINADAANLIWTSSNEKICKVVPQGNGKAVIYATGSGSAKVTAKAQDGSGKSVVIKVSVVQLAEEVQVVGQSTGIVPGGSASLKANVLPANTKNKKVEWEAVFASDFNKFTVTSDGKVTVSKDAIPGDDYLVVKAIPLDDSREKNIHGVAVITVCEKAASITFGPASGWNYQYYGSRMTPNKNMQLGGVTLFTVDINDGYNPGVDNQIKLSPMAYDANNNPITDYSMASWTSSNTKVATVDQDGLITAVGAGKAKITLTANDGSKKKATLNVTVKVPYSSISADVGDHWLLAAGKSIDLSKYVAYGSQYGKPTTTKADWEIYEIAYYDYDNNYIADLTDELTQGKKKYVSLTSGGKLKTTSALISYLEGQGYSLDAGYLEAFIGVQATDYLGYDDLIVIDIQKPVSKMVIAPTKLEMSKDSAGTVLYLNTDQYAVFEIKSSNPSICSAVIDWDGSLTGEGASYDPLGVYIYPVAIINNSGKTGKATITIKALDGSNKTAKVTVVVK